MHYVEDEQVAKLRACIHRLFDMQRSLTFDEQRDLANWLLVWADKLETLEAKSDVDLLKVLTADNITLTAQRDVMKAQNERLLTKEGELKEQIERLLAKEGERIGKELRRIEKYEG